MLLSLLLLFGVCLLFIVYCLLFIVYSFLFIVHAVVVVVVVLVSNSLFSPVMQKIAFGLKKKEEVAQRVNEIVLQYNQLQHQQQSQFQNTASMTDIGTFGEEKEETHSKKKTVCFRGDYLVGLGFRESDREGERSKDLILFFDFFFC